MARPLNATIRPAAPDDRDAVYDICVRTADAGEDASGVVDDPELFGHLYAGAYLAHAPDTSFVVEDDEGVAGYVVGATDSVTFAETLEAEWWPPLRLRYPEDRERRDMDSLLVALMHSPAGPDPAICATHPSHLHIDLLPRAQGQGLGARLMATIADAFSAGGSTGLHLGVSTRNHRAIGFYRHLGMRELHADPITLTLGWDLPRRTAP